MATNVTKEFVEEVKHRLVLLHDECIQKSGGTSGVLSEGSLDFTVYDILRFSAKHNDNPLLIAAYAYLTIATRHCFTDGNKRSAHLFAKELLLNMNIHIRPHYHTACSFIMKIASGEKTLEEIQLWLQQNTKMFEQKDKENYLNDLFYDIEHGEE